MSDGDAIYLSDYVDQALAKAVYDKLEDGTFAGRILLCKGVVAFGSTLRECEDELRSTLEDWILVGLKLGHTLPVIANIDLNKEPIHEPMERPGRWICAVAKRLNEEGFLITTYLTDAMKEGEQIWSR